MRSLYQLGYGGKCGYLVTLQANASDLLDRVYKAPLRLAPTRTSPLLESNQPTKFRRFQSVSHGEGAVSPVGLEPTRKRGLSSQPLPIGLQGRIGMARIELARYPVPETGGSPFAHIPKIGGKLRSRTPG
jgi:hypothetical protein